MFVVFFLCIIKKIAMAFWHSIQSFRTELEVEVTATTLLLQCSTEQTRPQKPPEMEN